MDAVSKTVRFLRSNAITQKIGRRILISVGLHTPTRKKREIIKKACRSTAKNLPIDVTFAYGITLFHNPKNTLTSRKGGFEPQIHQCLCMLLFLDRLRGNEPMLGDFGANIGIHTFAIKEKFPDQKIIAFDPSPYSWRYMELTIQQNDLTGIEVRKHAIGDDNGPIPMFTWGHNSSGDSIRDTGRQRTRNRETISVEIKRIDEIPDLPPITVIKIDCEGSEIDILKGMKGRLVADRPLIVTELSALNQKAFDLHPESVFFEVTKYDYGVYDIHFRRLDVDAFIALYNANQEDFILLPNELRLENLKTLI